MINKYKSLLNNKFIYIAAFAAAVVLYHLAMRSSFSDDLYFSTALNDQNLSDWLVYRYTNVNPRTIIEALLAVLSRNIFLWKILNVLLYFLLAYSLYELSHKASLFGVLALIIIYPVKEMSSAGWIATIMNYWWCLSFGFFSISIADKLYRGEKINILLIILSLPAALIAVSQELFCAIYLAVLLLYTVLSVLKKRSLKLSFFIPHYIITIVSLIYIFKSPAVAIRRNFEVINWMKDFYEKSRVDMLIDGFESTMNKMLTSENILFPLFTVFIFICVCKKTSKLSSRIISAVPMTASFFVIYTTGSGTDGFFGFFKYLSYISKLLSSGIGVTAENWFNISVYIPLALYIIIAACITASFIILFDDLLECCEYCFFLLGIADRTILI